jgi:hypothetical protein
MAAVRRIGGPLQHRLGQWPACWLRMPSNSGGACRALLRNSVSPIAALGHKSRVREALHKHCPGACGADGVQPVVAGCESRTAKFLDPTALPSGKPGQLRDVSAAGMSLLTRAAALTPAQTNTKVQWTLSHGVAYRHAVDRGKHVRQDRAPLALDFFYGKTLHGSKH